MLLRVAADAKDETDEDGVNALVEEERELATMATVAMAAVLNFIVTRNDASPTPMDGEQLLFPRQAPPRRSIRWSQTIELVIL